MARTVDETQRRKLAQDIAAALTLLYLGRSAEALAELGLPDTASISPAVRRIIQQKAAEESVATMDGINIRLQAVLSVITHPDEADALLVQFRRETDAYIAGTQIPNISAWAQQRGYETTMATTADPSNPGLSAQDANLWIWDQRTQFADDCADAAAASPAPYSDLVDIAGGEPPVHRNCQCQLYLAG